MSKFQVNREDDTTLPIYEYEHTHLPSHRGGTINCTKYRSTPLFYNFNVKMATCEIIVFDVIRLSDWILLLSVKMHEILVKSLPQWQTRWSVLIDSLVFENGSWRAKPRVTSSVLPLKQILFQISKYCLKWIFILISVNSLFRSDIWHLCLESIHSNFTWSISFYLVGVFTRCIITLFRVSFKVKKFPFFTLVVIVETLVPMRCLVFSSPWEYVLENDASQIKK